MSGAWLKVIGYWNTFSLLTTQLFPVINDLLLVTDKVPQHQLRVGAGHLVHKVRQHKNSELAQGK
jgi:hypothetical protein